MFHLPDEQLASILTTVHPTHTRLCKIATIPPHTITLFTPQTQQLSSLLTKSTNVLPIHIPLFETINIHPINVLALREALRTIMPSTTVHIPWSYPSSNYTFSTRRSSPLLHPTLFFLHPLTFLFAPSENPSRIETHDRVAAALGILPTDLPKMLKLHNHKLERISLDHQTTADIRAILRKAAVASYSRYERFMKKDLYGDSG